jgi:hypothetical protein
MSLHLWQNVNKLSTKAMLRMDVPPRPDPAGNKWLPDFIVSPLRASVSPTLPFPPCTLDRRQWISGSSHSESPCFSLTQPQYTSSPPSILLTSSTTRSAAQNKLLAIEKLYQLIVTSAESCIVTPTSEEQKEKVAKLVQREERRRREEKVKRGGKKESRRKGNWD